MLITKTPYRISFFGGGSDYPSWYLNYPGKVISTTIDKYLYITLKKPPAYSNSNYKISYRITEHENYLKNIKHPIVREMLKYYKYKEGIDINYDGDLPSKSGMGSSSSFVVGLMLAMQTLMGKKKFNKFSLANECVFFEQKILKEIVGSQDQIAASYGGFNLLKFNKKKFEINSFNKHSNFKKKLNSNLFLIYTGKQRRAHLVAKSYVNTLTNKNFDAIKAILQITSEAEKSIIKNNPDEFGKLLNEAWLVKKSLSKKVSNDKINELYKQGLNYGALGGKLLGAGGGGFILFYVPKKNHQKFTNKIGEKNVIHFNFENDGSQVIYNK